MTAPTPAKASHVGPLRVVAFGDSTTAPREGLTVYADLLAAGLESRGIAASIINAGVRGNNTNHAMERFDGDVLARDPHVVVLQFGINDSTWDVHKAPPATGPRVGIEQYEANLRSMVVTLHNRAVRVLLMTPNPLRWTPRMKELYGQSPYMPDCEDGFNVSLRQYAHVVRRVAAVTEATLVDVFAAYEAFGDGAAGRIDDLLLDGQHPNNDGHRLVGDLLLPLIVEEAGRLARIA